MAESGYTSAIRWSMGLLPLKALNGILTCCEEKQSSLDRSVEFVGVDVDGATGYLKGSSGSVVWIRQRESAGKGWRNVGNSELFHCR